MGETPPVKQLLRKTPAGTRGTLTLVEAVELLGLGPPVPVAQVDGRSARLRIPCHQYVPAF